jgi:tetratricopeptide (TPR) repeat protein
VISAAVAAQADATTDHLQRAADLIRRGELSLAEKQLEWVFKREPHEANALNLLGVIRAQQQRPREAEELFLRAIEANKSLFGAYLNIGQLNLQKGERRRAEGYFSAALEIRPDDVPTLRALANIARADGELEKALSYLVRARKIAPDSPEVLYDFGWTSLNMNLIYDALTALEQLHRMKVADPQYLYPLAIARLNNGQTAEALSLINQFIKARPQDGRGYFVRGAILYADKRFAEARDEFQRSFTLMPYPDTEYYLGMIAHQQGDDEQAISSFRHALRADPANAATYVALGTVLARQKNYQGARAELERAIELDPTDQMAYYQLGLVYARLGDKDRSHSMFALAEKLRTEQKEGQGTRLRLIDLPK